MVARMLAAPEAADAQGGRDFRQRQARRRDAGLGLATSRSGWRTILAGQLAALDGRRPGWRRRKKRRIEAEKETAAPSRKAASKPAGQTGGCGAIGPT